LELSIMTFNKQAVFAVFKDADNESASFAERLIALGVADRATARPLAMEWAATKYGEKLVEGQRGMTWAKRDTAAERAANRVLGLCFPAVDLPKAKTKSSNKADPVESLLKKFASLTAAEKRRFKAAI
jgi:hypothetical protein